MDGFIITTIGEKLDLMKQCSQTVTCEFIRWIINRTAIYAYFESAYKKVESEVESAYQNALQKYIQLTTQVLKLLHIAKLSSLSSCLLANDYL